MGENDPFPEKFNSIYKASQETSALSGAADRSIYFFRNPHSAMTIHKILPFLRKIAPQINRNPNRRNGFCKPLLQADCY